MKILFIQNTATISNILSGGEVRFLHIFRYFKAKYDCSLRGFFSLKEINDEINVNPTHVKRYTFYDKFSVYVAYVFKCLDFLAQILTQKNVYTHIYAASDFFPDVIPAYLLKRLNPDISWSQCVFHVYPGWKRRSGNKIVNFLAEKLQKFSFLLIKSAADNVVVINSLTADALAAFGFKKDRIKISPCGIDYSYLNSIPYSDLRYDGAFLSRLHPTKGIFDLVEIWKRVCQRKPDAKLGIIGGGSEDIIRKLRGMIKDAGLEHNITVHGYLPTEAAFPVVRSAKVFLFPSHEEGWGIAVAEAMALGVPVVLWNLRVFDEVFDDHVFKVPEGDVEAFAKQVNDILSDPLCFAKFVREATQFILRYSWDSVTRHEEQIMISLSAG